ncbi:MAG: hypothetical protein ACLSUW_09820 [Akkermansia sp.]
MREDASNQSTEYRETPCATTSSPIWTKIFAGHQPFLFTRLPD